MATSMAVRDETRYADGGAEARSDSDSIPESAQAELLDEAPEEDILQPGNMTADLMEIPDSLLDEEALSRLSAFIDQELNLARSERSQLIDEDLPRWQEMYKSPPPNEPKNFPIRNASNLQVPVILEVVNTIVAQLVQTTRAADLEWILEDLAAEWTPFKNILEKFLYLAAERDLRWEAREIAAVLEEVKYGTAVVEIVHEVKQRRLYQYTNDGTSVFPRDVTLHQGPKAYNVPLQDFFIREFEEDPTEAKWCAKRIWISDDDLLEMERVGRLYNVDRVINSGSTRWGADAVKAAQREAEGTSSGGNELKEVYEVWIRWPVGKERVPTELHMYYHQDTRTFLSRRFNPYRHGQRPFVRYVYFPVEHRFYGQGVITQIEGLQREISTIHNQRRDNATLANLKMLLTKRMIPGLRPGDPLYSGKIVAVSDPYQDVRELKLSEIYPSTVTEEQITRQYVERVSGVSEPRGAPVTRTTATAQLALLQEQAKKFDLTVRGNRTSKARVGALTLELYFQYGSAGKGRAWLGEEGSKVDDLFRLPRTAAELGLALRPASPTSQLNKESRRQNSLSLFNLMTQLYEKLLPMAQQFAPESLPMVANALVRSAHRFMGDTLASFDVTDPEEVLAGLTVLEQVLPNSEDLGGMDYFQRAATSARSLEQLGRLENLLRETARADDGRSGVRAGSDDSGGLAPAQGIPGGGLTGSLFGGEPDRGA
jgi:hypothetical protein